MVFIVRAHDPSLNESRPDTSAKIIRAKDFWAFKEAERAIADARTEQQRILAAAQKAYEEALRRGYEEGNESARLEQSGSMMELMGRTVDYYGKIETQMVDLVLDAVRKVVSDFDGRERVATAVRNCLEHVRDQKHLTIAVHPGHVEFLRGEVESLKAQYPSVSLIDIRPDPSLEEDACIVKTDIGVVEASLAGQVEALRTTLATVFDKLPVEGEGEEEDGEYLDDGEEYFEDEEDAGQEDENAAEEEDEGEDADEGAEEDEEEGQDEEGGGR